jgi:hypothetical protein
MSHAHHFLSRLDRVTALEVDLALSLYRDDGLVKYVLAEARVPEQYERAAISLDHTELGPFVVVTRDGRFVTCLGRGMAPTNLFVIPRERLDGYAGKVQVLRERFEHTAKMTDGFRTLGWLVDRLHDAAERLSREELRALAVFQPLLAAEFLHDMLRLSDTLERSWSVLLRELRRSDKLHRRNDELLHRFWRDIWTIGHLSVLCAMDGRMSFEHMPEAWTSRMKEVPFAWPAVRQGVFAVAMRGLWGVGRIGKWLLPQYKQRFAHAGSYLETIEAGMGLSLIGLRQTRLRAEVAKALATGPKLDAVLPGCEEVVRVLSGTIERAYQVAQSEPEELLEAHRKIGAFELVRLRDNAIDGSKYRFARAEDAPVDLARTMGCALMGNFVNSVKAYKVFCVAMPWLARAEPEDLYLPSAFLSEVKWSWTPEYAVDLLLKFRGDAGGGPKAQEGPTRNGPCHCGSGKKYKRCCGAG